MGSASIVQRNSGRESRSFPSSLHAEIFRHLLTGGMQGEGAYLFGQGREEKNYN